MSEVALSPAACLIRLAGLPQAGSGACRSLFGPVDHQELRQELRGRLRKLAEEAQERWGFDFQAGTPVTGARLRWEPVCATAVPAFYREEATRRGDGPGLECSGGDAEPGAVCPEAAPAERVSQEQGAQMGDSSGPARITDYFPNRKRSASSKTPCEELPSDCTIPAEKTPRKRLR